MGSLLSRDKIVRLGDVFPDFEAKTTEGDIKLHNFLGNSWGIFFSHPADFTPVCTTELGRVAQLAPEFKKRGVKLIALSINSAESHHDWIKDIESYCSLSGKFPFPIICDEKRHLAVKFGMLDPDKRDSKGMVLTCRAVFIIAPDKRLKLSILYPATTGRNFDEILRVVDSLQLTNKFKVSTPVDWKNGDKVMVDPSVKPDDFDTLFPQGVEVASVPSGRDYLRKTAQPK